MGDTPSRILRKNSSDESKFVTLSICPAELELGFKPNQAAGLALQKKGSL